MEMGDDKDPITEIQEPQLYDTKDDLSDSDRIAKLDYVFTCLKSKNDTRRFIGLTLLMTYLEDMQSDYRLTTKCWAAIPSTFITRLLRTRFRDGTIRHEVSAEDQTKFQLGLTTLHSFASLLPTEYLQDMLPTDMPAKTWEGWSSRIEALMVEVPYRYPVPMQLSQPCCSH